MPKTEKGIMIASLGGYGGKVIANTEEHTPDAGFKYVAIVAISDTVITAPGNIDGVTSLSIPAGFPLYGEFDSITLTSGAVVAYQGGAF